MLSPCGPEPGCPGGCSAPPPFAVSVFPFPSMMLFLCSFGPLCTFTEAPIRSSIPYPLALVSIEYLLCTYYTSRPLAYRRAHTTPCVSWRSARRATPLTLWGELRCRDMVVPLSSLAFTCRGDKATKKCSKRRVCDAPTTCAWQKQVGVSHKPTAGLLCRASCRRRSENRQNGRRRRRTERAQSLRRSCSVPTYRTSRHT